ncbi:MAG: 50S ribosomal protein L28 [Myxococcales bacterium]|nr:50S ribosomal protein L28 [Myxococcales bacterium]
MARKCQVTGAKALYGNRVSHANNRTRRRQEINLQSKRLWDADKGTWVRLRVTTRALRMIDQAGGLAEFRRQQARKGTPLGV